MAEPWPLETSGSSSGPSQQQLGVEGSDVSTIITSQRRIVNAIENRAHAEIRGRSPQMQHARHTASDGARPD